MSNSRLSMSFTSGALLYHESIVIAELHTDLADWDAVRRTVIEENRLQMRTLNASKRICREVNSRLRQLTAQEMALLCDGTRAEQNYLLWLGICLRYRFIHAFAIEVLREKYLRFDMMLAYEDYDIFFNKMAEWHPEMETVAPSTREKQRQIVFKMMREADLITGDGRILPVIFTPLLVATIQADDPAHFTPFPLSETDIKMWIR